MTGFLVAPVWAMNELVAWANYQHLIKWPAVSPFVCNVHDFSTR